MNLKQILESIVADLEHAGAIIGAVEAALIDRGLLSRQEVDSYIPQMQADLHNRLRKVQTSIGLLPD